MSYSLSKKTIKPRDAALLDRAPPTNAVGQVTGPPPYDAVAPGLYPDEAVVVLGTGELVAVSVEEDYRGNDIGVNLRGYARWINPDGSTRTTPDGHPVESVGCVGVAHFEITADGLDAYRREMLRMMLGEEPTLRAIDNPPDARPHTAAEIEAAETALSAGGKSVGALAHDPDATETPLLAVPAEARAAANIHNAINSAQAMLAAPDPAALLVS